MGPAGAGQLERASAQAATSLLVQFECSSRLGSTRSEFKLQAFKLKLKLIASASGTQLEESNLKIARARVACALARAQADRTIIYGNNLSFVAHEHELALEERLRVQRSDSWR